MIKSSSSWISRQVTSYWLLPLIVTVFALSACHKSDPNIANANSATTNSSLTAASPSVNNNANSAASVAPEATPATTTVSLATPTDSYKTGYNARKNKDFATLKRVMSKDALEFLTEIGKLEKKSLDDQLKALCERPQNDSSETRNEKINGDRATLDYLNEKGAWVQMDFSKEGNEWKIGLPKAP